jgi:hypothetical protein
MSRESKNESVLVPSSQHELGRDCPIRVIGTLTTMPDKYPLLTKTLDSLLAQTYKLDAIYLGLPQVSRRLGIPYPKLPSEISRKCTVVHTEDYGPITKLMGALLSENDPNTIIISFDDDRHYPPDLVESLIRHHHEYPQSAIGSSGMLLSSQCPSCAIYPNERSMMFRIPKFHVGREGRRVDSIYGYPGALYIRKMFPAVDRLEYDFLRYSLLDNNMLMNDDITISGYLSLHRIERRIFADIPEVNHSIPDGQEKRVHGKDEISYNLDFFFQRMNACIKKCKEYGMYAQPESVSATETVLGVGLVLFLLILLILLLLAYMIFWWRPPTGIF